MYATPPSGPIFRRGDISTTVVTVVPPVPKKGSPLEAYRRELSEDVPPGAATVGTAGTLLVVEQSSLEILPRRGCDTW